MDEHSAAIDSMKQLLAELPAEFSKAPPFFGEDARIRPSFQVVKEVNVVKVHRALWDLQVYLGMQEAQ